MFSHIKEFFTRPSGYNIQRSVRLRSSASAYLNRTPASAGNRKTWTWSGWVKRGKLSTDQTIFSAGYGASPWFILQFDSGDVLDVSFTAGVSGGTLTTAVYRDPSAWYHIVLATDTTQATASNRIKLYVNGIQVTSFSSTNYPTQNTDYQVNNTVQHYIGYGAWYLDGYLTEINFIDGQALTPSSFGSTNATTGVWQPAKYTGTYGTNGFYLNFSNNASTTTLGYDTSGNSNNWTTNNISLTAGATYDSMTDVPTLTSATAANYCVLNPLGNPNSPITTYSDGNLTWSNTASSGNAPKMTVISTIGNTSGKWYFEQTAGSNVNQKIGFSSSIVNGTAAGSTYFNYNSGGSIEKSTGITVTGTPASYTTNDVVGVAFDIGAGTATFYKNNVSQSTLSNIPSDTWFAYAEANSSASASNGYFNFGQRPFSYTPPTGYVALNTFNLPASTITNGATVMAATTFNGITGGTQTITNTVNGTSFKPDLVWMKLRSGVQDHFLIDSVRGSSNYLVSDSTAAEVTGATAFLTSFNSNGWSLGSGGYGNGVTVVGWQWQAGQGSSSSNTNGSITSTVSVNATAGFSVVTYTGTGANATVGHGLGVAPKMIILKQRNAVDYWVVWQTTLGSTGYLLLNSTNGSSTAATYWNSTLPSSTVFSLGSDSRPNGSGTTYVAYCWSEVAGFSKFGSYTGNGSADGPFIFTGFQPKWIMVKQSSAAGEDWLIQDTSRKPYNTSTTGTSLAADTSGAEVNSSAQLWDVLSNGFKLRATGGGINGSGATYIYVAFASNPFSKSLAF